MSVITPTLSATSDVARSHDRASSTPPRSAFQRPVAPEPDPARDNELLSLYFDGTWTTKDIADHFKLPIAVIAAWFQRSDIAALIDLVAAANERRARDIAREGIPGTIDILHRISRTRNSDKVACAASNALIRFSRGQASAALAAKRSTKHADTQEEDESTASARSRSASSAPPRGPHPSDSPSPHAAHPSDPPNQRNQRDQCAQLDHECSKCPSERLHLR
jgi:hypothetical protein